MLGNKNGFVIKMLAKTLVASSVLLSVSASSMFATETTVEDIKVPVAHCSAPVLSIAIMDVECTAGSCHDTSSPKGGIAGIASLITGSGGVKGLGSGVKTMFSNAINESKCFKVVDLAKIEKVRQMMAQTGQSVTPPKIDMIVNTSITAIDISRNGGALLGVISVVSKTTEVAEIAVDVSTMNPTTMEVGESKSFRSNSESTSWGFGGGAATPGGTGGIGWSITKNVVLDSVIRDAIFSATNYLAETYAKDKIVDRPAPK